MKIYIGDTYTHNPFMMMREISLKELNDKVAAFCRPVIKNKVEAVKAVEASGPLLTTRALFDSLSPEARMEFVRVGGQLKE